VKKKEELTPKKRAITNAVFELNKEDQLMSVFRAIAVVARKKKDTGPLLVQLTRRLKIPQRECRRHIEQLDTLGLVKGYYDKNSRVRQTLTQKGEEVMRQLYTEEYRRTISRTFKKTGK
jgi:DNA-binding MarR family transcriptional regulator